MKSEGTCNFCKKRFLGSAMLKHLQACTDRKKQIESDKAEGKVFLIKASCEPFWVYFETNSTSTLSNIDSFLRDLWLECCGHLSLFTINGINYASNPQPGHGDKSIDISIDKVLSKGLVFHYEYDFGTTTYLALKAISTRTGNLEDINIIARNIIPDLKCKCGQLAKEICIDRACKGNGLLCKKCTKKYECGEEMLLPFVNSPRSGMCGYTGED